MAVFLGTMIGSPRAKAGVEPAVTHDEVLVDMPRAVAAGHRDRVLGLYWRTLDRQQRDVMPGPWQLLYRRLLVRSPSRRGAWMKLRQTESHDELAAVDGLPPARPIDVTADGDVRSPFERDHGRILFSNAFLPFA